MSAASPKVPEPSMEEILASIRRIIADDQDGVRAAPPFSAQRSTADDDHGAAVAELRPRRAGPADFPPDTAAATFDEPLEPAESEAAAEEETPNPAFEAPPLAPPVAAAPREDPDSLLSPAAQATAAIAFQRLSAAVHAPGRPRTLEDHVTEMLRPLLKAWLDENLPPIVERLVQDEIERVARGGA